MPSLKETDIEIDILNLQAEEMGEQAEKAGGPSLDKFLGQLSNKVWNCYQSVKPGCCFVVSWHATL